MNEEQKRIQLVKKWARAKRHPRMELTPLSPDQPAKELAKVVEVRGEELTASAIHAWQKRLDGVPIVTVAHEMGVSIEGAKQLIKEAHAAISEDLKTNLAINRELDLERTDYILKAFLPAAKDGDRDSAAIVLKALSHRARLTGTEPQADPGRSKPENILVWIQAQLPAINKIVDSLPSEYER
jgi:hypothetical protein